MKATTVVADTRRTHSDGTLSDRTLSDRTHSDGTHSDRTLSDGTLSDRALSDGARCVVYGVRSNAASAQSDSRLAVSDP